MLVFMLMISIKIKKIVFIYLFCLYQTEEQYIFIHDALLEAVTCGETEVPVRNLPLHIQQLSQMDPGTTVTGMELEFKVKHLIWY